jgi:hypothetical protein
MADEPNTNPDSGEGEKPAREAPVRSEPAKPKSTRKATSKTRRSASGESTGSSSSSASKPRKSAAPLQETYSEFSASLQQLEVETAKKCKDLLDKVTADVEKLKNDMTSSDPTKSFVRDLTEAILKSDSAAVAEAYAALYRHNMQRHAAAEKRVLDIVTGYYSGLGDIAELAQRSFLSDARNYSDSVAEAIAGSKLSELKPKDQTVAAQALLLGAIVQASSQHST